MLEFIIIIIMHIESWFVKNISELFQVLSFFHTYLQYVYIIAKNVVTLEYVGLR